MEIEIIKGKYLSDLIFVANDREVEIERLVKNVYARDPLAKISFDAEESAHMGYESYDIDQDSSLDQVIKDIENGIVFVMRIEFAEGLISSRTTNLINYSFSPVEEMTEKEVEILFEELFN